LGSAFVSPKSFSVSVRVKKGASRNSVTQFISVAMENSLKKVDEFMHISRRMRSIALQTAVGGMLLSAGAMMFAAAGYLAPVAGAITQEIIDMLPVLNALRASFHVSFQRRIYICITCLHLSHVW
jgi:hypothetical protein